MASGDTRPRWTARPASRDGAGRHNAALALLALAAGATYAHLRLASAPEPTFPGPAVAVRDVVACASEEAYSELQNRMSRLDYRGVYGMRSCATLKRGTRVEVVAGGGGFLETFATGLPDLDRISFMAPDGTWADAVVPSDAVRALD
jgi:hypothetical protein